MSAVPVKIILLTVTELAVTLFETWTFSFNKILPVLFAFKIRSEFKFVVVKTLSLTNMSVNSNWLSRSNVSTKTFPVILTLPVCNVSELHCRLL